MVQGYVEELNTGLNRWETIKKFTILDRDLTVETGEMTPSLKLRRKIVVERYGLEHRLAAPPRCRTRVPGPTFGHPSAGLRWLRAATRYACCRLSP